MDKDNLALLQLILCINAGDRYEGERRMRVGAIHGFARMAAIMASTYKGYLGEGLGPLAEPLMSLKIPHPGKVGGYFAMTPTMPAMLAWVLGGNYKNLEGRAPYCSLESMVSAQRVCPWLQAVNVEGSQEKFLGKYLVKMMSVSKRVEIAWALLVS